MPSRAFQWMEYGLLIGLTVRLLMDAHHHQHVLYDPIVTVIAIITPFLLYLHRWRRELITAYAAVAVYLYLHLIEWRGLKALDAMSFWHHVPFKLCVLGVSVAWIMVWLFPLPNFTKLPGPYKTIGCHTGRYGGVECRIFYPSSMEVPTVPSTQRIKYLHHGVHLAKGLSVFSSVPHWLFNNLSNAFLSSIEEAPMATPRFGGKRPVVIFSHGLAGSLELYSSMNEQLASHGNIVVVLNHCDGSASVARPEDHRVEYYQKVSKDVIQNVNGAGFRFRNAQLKHRVQEIRRVLNAIEKEHHKAASLFAHADFDKVYLCGHSFGGATVMTAPHVDPRFRKVVLLDAWMEPVAEDVKDQGLASEIPCLHIISEHFADWKVNMDDMKRHMRHCTHPASKLLILAGSRHNNFSDLPLFSPIINRLMQNSGKIDPYYAIQATSLLSAAFFQDHDHYAPLLSNMPAFVPVEC